MDYNDVANEVVKKLSSLGYFARENENRSVSIKKYASNTINGNVQIIFNDNWLMKYGKDYSNMDENATAIDEDIKEIQDRYNKFADFFDENAYNIEISFTI